MDYDPNEMVDGLLGALVSAKFYPDAIMARTEETLTIIEPFCKKAKIKLVKSNELDELDDAIDAMMERMEESDDFESFCQDCRDCALNNIEGTIEDCEKIYNAYNENTLTSGDVAEKVKGAM